MNATGVESKPVEQSAETREHGASLQVPCVVPLEVQLESYDNLEDSKVATELSEPVTPLPRAKAPRRGWRFWVIFCALCVSLLLVALDLASVATALPQIIHDLNGTSSFAWVSAAYTLACSAVLPLSGRLADVFGRRAVLLSGLVLFALGSAISGSAKNMNMLIAGRAVQGIGGGAIQVLVNIVIGDLVPLRERGLFTAITGATYSLASVGGPFIGGALAQYGAWRWLFYLNLPLCGIALAVVFFFLRVQRPPASDIRSSLLTLDWIGNALIIGSTASCIIALTWAGVNYPWTSFRVLVPLILGFAGLTGSLLYELFVAKHPLIPAYIVSNRTSISGYISSFMHGVVLSSAGFYLPVYFQAVKMATPLLSGLYILPSALVISPSAIVQGILVRKTGYRIINLIGWCATLIGVGLWALLQLNTSIGVSVVFQIIAAFGFGLLYITTFVVLAPLPVSANAPALSLLVFARTFAQSWGVSISASIVQTQLEKRLPAAFLATFPAGEDITYTIIPLIPGLAAPLQDEVRAAFAGTLTFLWEILLVFCGVGLLTVALQKELPLHTKTDEKWGMEEKERPAGRADEAA